MNNSNERALTQKAIEEVLKGGTKRKRIRFVLAALSSIPWVGGFLSASVAWDAEKEQGKVNDLYGLWLEEHRGKLRELGITLAEILSRLETFGEDVEQRIQSEPYLNLVKNSHKQKSSHAYYYQIMGQMGLTGALWCDLYIWCRDDYHLERIHFVPEKWEEMKIKVDLFYFNYYLPKCVKH